MTEEVTAGEAYRYADAAMKAVQRHEAECGERWREARAAMDVVRSDVQKIRLELAADRGAREARRQLWDRQMRRLHVWGGAIATLLVALQMLGLWLRAGSLG